VMLEVACPRVLDAQALLEAEPGIFEATVFGTRLHVVVGEEPRGRRQISDSLTRAGLTPVSVERIVPSLEDVFIHCIEAEETKRRAS
jgi:ABC-2 type transport system ATP-binding protein